MAFTAPAIAANDTASTKSATIDVGLTKTVQSVSNSNDGAAVPVYRQVTQQVTFTDSNVVSDNQNNIVVHVPVAGYAAPVGTQTAIGVTRWVMG